MSKRQHEHEHADAETAQHKSGDGAGEHETPVTASTEGAGEAGGAALAPAARISELERELAELKDKYLRALADGENARKRIRQQAEESTRLQRENLLRELLPVVDNLERALDAARGGGDGDSIVSGVEMVLRSLMDFLKAQGVTPQTSVGQPFNPGLHEAVDRVTSDAHPPNTVVSEFHRGYQIGERVLRPARVVVAKGAGGATGGGARNGGEDPDAGD